MPRWPRKKTITRTVAPAIDKLRTIHSGHVGDHVAFLTFGVAAFAIVLGVLIKIFGV